MIVFLFLLNIIWGWMNNGPQGLKKIMLIWTVGMVVLGLGAGLFSAGAASQLQEMQQSLDSMPEMPVAE